MSETIAGAFMGWNPNLNSYVLRGRGDRDDRPARLLLQGWQQRLAVAADPPGVDVDRRTADRALGALLRVGGCARRTAERPVLGERHQQRHLDRVRRVVLAERVLHRHT